MKPIRRMSAVLLLAGIAIAACNAGAQDDAAGAPSAASLEGTPAGASAPAGPPAAAEGSLDSYEVRIASGPFAGTHTGSGEMSCFAQEGTWGADLTLDRDHGLTMIYLMLAGVPETGGSTEDVNLGLTYGQLDDIGPGAGGTGIGGAIGGGTGRATVERDGDRAVIRIEGTTVHGAPVTAVVRCGQIS